MCTNNNYNSKSQDSFYKDTIERSNRQLHKNLVLLNRLYLVSPGSYPRKPHIIEQQQKLQQKLRRIRRKKRQARELYWLYRSKKHQEDNQVVLDKDSDQTDQHMPSMGNQVKRYFPIKLLN